MASFFEDYALLEVDICRFRAESALAEAPRPPQSCEIIPILSLLEVDIFNYGMRAQGFNPKTEVGERVQGF